MKNRDTLVVPKDHPMAAAPRQGGNSPVALRIGGGGARAGTEIALPREVERFAVGSDAGNQVVLDDRYVSAFHCLLERRGPHRMIVRDRQSRNGTYVNGNRVHESDVEPGARLQIGGLALTVVGSRGLATRPAHELLIGDDPRFRATLNLALRTARTAATVLVQGESGSGKELIARLVHEASPRAAGPLVALNCGAIPRDLVESELFGHEKGAFTGANERRAGVFEQADGGTLFLDEIGELPREQQPRLLRVLETRRVRRVGGQAEQAFDVRIVAATHRELRTASEHGEFRLNLFHRLSTVELRLPPLRERPGDLPRLVEFFLAEIAGELGHRRIAAATLDALARYAWPGNVRELRNAIHRAAVLSDDELALADLLPDVEPLRPLASTPRLVVPAPAQSVPVPVPSDGVPEEALPDLAVDDVLRALIERALRRHGSYRKAAAALGMSKSTLHDKARRFGLSLK